MGKVSEEVLLVDDEGTLLKLMSVYLRRLGYTATPVNTVAKAWEQLKRNPDRFAVVVLDAGMAETGIDDLVMKLFAAYPHLRLVVNSGYPVDMSMLQQAVVRRMLGPQEEV
jgi:DNA-binding NtrC family response regulator